MSTSNVGFYINTRTGDMRISGQITDRYSCNLWIPGSTLQWLPAPTPPSLNAPAGIALGNVIANAQYRHIGNEIVYNFNYQATATGSISTNNYTLNLPYEIKYSSYSNATIIGTFLVNVWSASTSNVYSGYAQTSTVPTETLRPILRYINATADRSLGDLTPATIKLQGQLTYTTPLIANNVQAPIQYTLATFNQDQDGKVIFNGSGAGAQAQFHVVSSSNNSANISALTVDQKGPGPIVEFLDAGLKKVVIDGNGNVGIGTTIPKTPLDLSQTTSALILPTGSTAQQPSVPQLGMIRFNTTIYNLEYYNGTTWFSIGNVIATGGNTTTDLNATRIHTFTGSGTFTVSKGGTIDFLMVAGGGGGGWDVGGGGGAGGLIWGSNVTITPGTYSIVVGGGGPGSTTLNGNASTQNGQNTTFNGLTAIGGGGGGNYVSGNGATGGSGGGASGYTAPGQPGTGTTGQGNRGGYANSGNTTANTGGGGGGAGGVGSDSIQNNASFVAGGAGLFYSISGTSITYAQGGRGAGDQWSGGVVGTTNRGFGGDGGGTTASVNNGLAGGSGIVIIRYFL
jgi:hypothetical protein